MSLEEVTVLTCIINSITDRSLRWHLLNCRCACGSCIIPKIIYNVIVYRRWGNSYMTSECTLIMLKRFGILHNHHWTFNNVHAHYYFVGSIELLKITKLVGRYILEKTWVFRLWWDIIWYCQTKEEAIQIWSYKFIRRP